MKRIDELTREELCALTDDQIEILTELEIAHAGIMPVERPTYEQVPVVDIKATDQVYEVHGVVVRSKEDADILAKIEACGSTYDYSGGSGYDYKYLNDPEPGTIKVVRFYTEEDVKSVGKTLRLKKAVEERNAAKRKTYNEYESSIGEITDHVSTLVNSARDFASSLVHAESIFEKHLKLAEGNYGIAVNFFKVAYKGNNEVMERVLAKKNLTVSIQPATQE